MLYAGLICFELEEGQLMLNTFNDKSKRFSNVVLCLLPIMY